MPESATRLLQRDHHLAEAAGWLDEAAGGRGRVALIAAGAGLGKTTLLRQIAEGAGPRFTVRAAQGRVLERDMAFGVARQLFETLLLEMPQADRAAVLSGAAGLAEAHVAGAGAGQGADISAIVHGLYWVTVNLSERSPLVLLVDDAHWADAPTLRWLTYLAPRAADLPLLVIVSARPGEPGAERDYVHELTGAETVDVLGLDPLDGGAVATLLGERLGRPVDPDFADACHRVTGGNPFYLNELARAAQRDDVTSAAQVRHLTTVDVSRSVLVRLQRIGARATDVAAAVAVLSAEAHPRHLANLLGIGLDETLSLIDRLAEAEVLRHARPVDFIHPIARSAVYDDLPSATQNRLHRRAAELLAAEGVPPDRVGVHALACEPAGDPQIVIWLRAAADHVLAAGAPETAARFLRRALAEPPAAELRAPVAMELGHALMGRDVTAASEAFEAAARSPDLELSGAARRWQGQMLGFAGRPEEALRALEQALELAGEDGEHRRLLEATRDFWRITSTADPDWQERSRRLQAQAERLEGRTPTERRVLSAASLDMAFTGSGSAAAATALANRVRAALATWLDVSDPGVETPAGIGFSSIVCDDEEAIERHLRAAAETTRRGRTLNLAGASAQLAHLRMRRGDLVDAEGDARLGWSLLGEIGSSGAFHWWSLATLVDVLVARGSVAEAAAVADDAGMAKASEDRSWSLPCPPLVPVVVATLRLARDDAEGALAVLTRDAAWLEDRGLGNPSLNPWRVHAATALLRLGRDEEARSTIDPALAQARAFGAPWALGMALRAAGMTRPGEEGERLLGEAVAVHAEAGCRSELAHTHLELGARLRRENRRSEGREHLRRALDLATRCGAQALAARARTEIAATGARPRRELLSGPASLTASERRVAEMAAAGRSNPEIAQALFVTRKTVEHHLSHVFAKLGIRSRNDLPAALGGGMLQHDGML